MKKAIVTAVVIVFSILLNSCSTSNDVISSNAIQKRKYRKGFFVGGGTPSSTADFKQERRSQKSIASDVEVFENELVADIPTESA